MYRAQCSAFVISVPLTIGGVYYPIFQRSTLGHREAEQPWSSQDLKAGGLNPEFHPLPQRSISLTCRFLKMLKKVSSQRRCGTSDLHCPFNRDYGECIRRASTVPASGHVAGVILQMGKASQEMGQTLAGVLAPQLSHHLHPHCWESAKGPGSVSSCKFLNLNPKVNCHQGCYEA